MAKTGKRVTATVVESPEPETAPGIETPKKDRRSFPATEDGGIKWDGFKSDKHRDAMRRLVAQEAEALGYVKPAEAGAVVVESLSDKLTAAQLFTLVNVIAQPLALRFTGCTVEQAATLNIDDADLAVLNKGGITDRMIEKYLPSVQLGLELTWTMALLSVAAGKWATFNQARLTAKLDAEKKIAPSPAAPRDNVLTHPTGVIRAASEPVAEAAAVALA